MATDGLAAAQAAELLRRQDALQAEAAQVIGELELPATLGRAGRAVQIGSSVSGLMVWRDLDFSILCPGAGRDRIAEILRSFIAHPRLRELHYRDELGPRSPSGRPEDKRHYAVMRYEAATGAVWKIDLSFWVSDAPRGELSHPHRLARQLTDETRLAILRLKDIWHRLPSYPDQVGGMEVYDAVLAHGVRTPDEFAAYLRERGLPTR